MSATRIDSLRRAKQRVASAQQELVRTMHRAFPPGAPITWLKGNRRHAGVVVVHGHGDRLLARASTGSTVTLCAADIIRAGGQ